MSDVHAKPLRRWSETTPDPYLKVEGTQIEMVWNADKARPWQLDGRGVRN